MSTSKLIIYSEDVHDYVLLAYLELISILKPTVEIDLITYNSKVKRISKDLDAYRIKGLIDIKFLNSLGKKNSNKTLALLNKYLIKAPKYFANVAKIFFITVKSKPNQQLIITEIYNKFHAYIIYFIIIKLKRNRHFILTIHNADKFLYKDSIYNKLFKASSKIVVLSENVKSYLVSHTKNHTFVFPASLPNQKILNLRSKNLKAINNDEIMICVTGSIDQKRKDYKKIIDYFSTLDSSDFKLIFLGKLVSREVIQYAFEKNVDVIYFEHFIADDEFSEILSKVHFLFSLNSSSSYLKTKISGIIYDSLRYAVPLISDNPSFSVKSINHILIKDLKDFQETFEYYKKHNIYKTLANDTLELSKKSLPQNLVIEDTNIKRLFDEI